MDLTLAQLRQITLGATDICSREDGIHFFRMSDAQRAAFTAATASFGPKCLATSCIRLDFHTDSSTLTLEWCNAVTTTRTILYFDVLVDGEELLHSGTMDCRRRTAGGFTLQLPEGEHRVQVFFPTLTGFTLGRAALDDGASLRPHGAALRFLLYGDSITQGYDAIHPSSCYANLLGRWYDAEIVNQAVGGAVFDPATPEGTGRFDLVITAYGSNDWTKKDAAAFRDDAAAYMDRVSQLYAAVPRVLILPIWRADYLGRTTAVGDFPASRALLAQLGRERGFHVVDDFHLVPHETALLSDGYLHPNDAGFAPFARRLAEQLEAFLPALRKGGTEGALDSDE